ncbi:MAG: tetratricopeptide repeat protein [Pyrinomonadaceae bacterium]
MNKKRIVILSVIIALLGCTGYIAATMWLTARGTASTQLDKNITFLESRVKAFPDDSETYRMLASGLVQRAEATGNAADYDRAMAEIDKADELDPNSLRLTQARAITLFSRHHFQETKAVAEKGLERDPDNADLLGLAGDGALESGDLATAEKHYQHLVETSPKLTGAWARLSHLEEVRGNFAKASELMEKSINAGYPKPLGPAGVAWARSILGEIEAKRGNLDEARRQYNWALAKVPDYPLALEFLADLEQWQGHPDKAEEIYRNLLSKKADPKWQVSLATLLEKRGVKGEAAELRAEARKFYEQTVASGNDGYLRSLATLELDEHNYQRAAELAARDMALRPTAESRAIYANIIKAANDAGQPLTLAQNVQ